MTLATRNQTPFMEMEARDEQQILATIEGQFLTEFVYKVEGKIGLSLVGVNHMCFKMGHIKVDPVSARIEYDELDDEYTAYMVAINGKYELSAMGVSTQPRMMEIHVKDDQGKWVKNEDGSWKMTTQRDRFAKTKAMSKAERNAKRKVIPEAIIKAYLDYFMKLKEGKPAKAPSFQSLDLDKTPTQSPNKPKTVESTQKSVGIPSFKRANGEAVDTVSVELLENYLAGEGLDVSQLDMSDEGAEFKITPAKYLDKEWSPINTLIRTLGGEWKKVEGEKNYWSLPKEGFAETEAEEEKPPEAEVPDSSGKLKSINEIDYVIDQSIVGARDLLMVTEGATEFTVEPMKALEEEIVDQISNLLAPYGGVYQMVPGVPGFQWMLKKE